MRRLLHSGRQPENKKMMTFSRNWEIRLVFTKGRLHGLRKEKINAGRWETPS